MTIFRDNYTGRERQSMSKATKDMRTRVDEIKTILADMGATTVADVRNESFRQKAAYLIRAARRAGNPDLAVDLRDRWHERVAICIGDGGLSEKDAERVAWHEIDEQTSRTHLWQEQLADAGSIDH